jgi:hypothetical protein
LLYNLFEDNPSESNFIAFSLQRSLDPDGDVEGLFSIGKCLRTMYHAGTHLFFLGQYDPQYAAVADRPRIPTWPVHSPKRWNVLLEALLIGDKTVIPNTTVPNAPGAIALLDSGTSYTSVLYFEIPQSHIYRLDVQQLCSSRDMYCDIWRRSWCTFCPSFGSMDGSMRCGDRYGFTVWVRVFSGQSVCHVLRRVLVAKSFLCTPLM